MKKLLLILCLFGVSGARAQVQPDQLPPLAACQALCEDLLNAATIHASVTKRHGIVGWVRRLRCAEECMSYHTAKEVADIRLWLLQRPDGDYSDAAWCMSTHVDWKGCFEEGR